jgi:hypothetical protein
VVFYRLLQANVAWTRCREELSPGEDLPDAERQRRRRRSHRAAEDGADVRGVRRAPRLLQRVPALPQGGAVQVDSTVPYKP